MGILTPQDFNKDKLQNQLSFLRDQINKLTMLQINNQNNIFYLCRHLKVTQEDIKNAEQSYLKEMDDKDK